MTAKEKKDRLIGLIFQIQLQGGYIQFLGTPSERNDAQDKYMKNLSLVSAAKLREWLDHYWEINPDLVRKLTAAEPEQPPKAELKKSRRAEKPEPLEKKLNRLSGVTVEIHGRQTTAPVLWVFGDTRPHAAELKAAGLRYSPKKCGWWIKYTAA